jgi:stage II sporulation protein P
MFFEYRLRRVKLYYFNVNKFLLFSGFLLFLFLLVVFPLRYGFLRLAFAYASGLSGSPALILSEGIAGIETEEFDESVIAHVVRNDWGKLLAQGIRKLTGVDTGDSFTLLCQELNLIHGMSDDGGTNHGSSHDGSFLAAAVFSIKEEEGGEEDFYLPELEEGLEEWITIPEDEYPPVQINGAPMVLIYTTHNAESYKPTQGVSKVEGKNGGIAAVSSMFAKVLESKHYIKTIYSDVIHDYPDFTKSYFNSMQTVKRFLQEYPQIQVVLDIHRDAGLNTRGDTLVKINGKECAKVMIVVGTEHQHYKQNLAFAEKLARKADELYPGLIKDVRLFKDRRYNQNLHTRALLLEFGSDLNKEAEAVESAKLMADVVASVLKQD